jgi:hypothetical protein
MNNQLPGFRQSTRSTDHCVAPRPLHVNRLRIAFQTSRVQAIVAIPELNNAASGVTHSQVVFRSEVLQGFHEPTLHVSGFCSLDCSVDQALTTRDSVEEELGRRETAKEAVAYEPFRRRFSRLLREVRQGTVLEAVWNTMPSNDLLSYTSRHLSDVDHGACKVSETEVTMRIKISAIPLEPQVAMMSGALYLLSSFIQISPT